MRIIHNILALKFEVDRVPMFFIATLFLGVNGIQGNKSLYDPRLMICCVTGFRRLLAYLRLI
jgi:hypothetical protein